MGLIDFVDVLWLTYLLLDFVYYDLGTSTLTRDLFLLIWFGFAVCVVYYGEFCGLTCLGVQVVSFGDICFT